MKSFNQKQMQQKGFTIIELLIATTVFSMVLLICSIALLQIARVYYKGITESKVHETARSVTENISRAIQFSGGNVVPTPATITAGSPFVFCINNQRYSAVTDRELVDSNPSATQSYHVLVVDPYSGCASNTPAQNLSSTSITGQELMDPSTRLATLTITDQGNNLYKIDVRVVYGDDDLLDNAHQNCANVRSGSQFCAVSELVTTVEKRI